MSEVFKNLYEIDVNERTKSKNGLSYLSWAWAWAEVKKKYPDATYEIKKFENNLPYVFDEQTGYMVFTEVTIDEQTHEMWLPVMDHSNNAMKNEPYQIKYGKKTVSVQPATMFDINNAIMRCLTKNLAMFGLGLYIYAGEDIPEPPKPDLVNEQDVKAINQKIETLAELLEGSKEENIGKLNRRFLGQAKINSFTELQADFLGGLLEQLDKLIEKFEEKGEPEESDEQESLFEGNTTTAKGSD